MEDDLAGIAWTDEQEERRLVEARVQAESSIAQITAKKNVAKAWAALQSAEEHLAALADVPLDARAQNHQQQERQAQDKVRSLGATLRQLQLTSELSRKNEMEKILRATAAQPRQQQVRHQAPQLMQEDTTMMDDSTRRASSVPVRPARDLIKIPAARLLKLPVRPSDVKASTQPTNAVAEYQNGNVLPSVNQVTALSCGKRKREYLDDGDLSLFAARQRSTAAANHSELHGQEVAVDAAGQPNNTTVLDASQRMYVPSAVWDSLLDYQRVGVGWLMNLHLKRVGGILGDEMGLGKTIQIAALLSALNASKRLVGPTLIVAPLTVLSQWVMELHSWVPELRSCIFHASGTATAPREQFLHSVKHTTAIVLTTYAAITAHCQLLNSVGFQYVILDEGHKISNPDSGMTIAAKAFVSPHRIILTGSPIQNSLKELWSLFDFVVPGLLGSVNTFVTEFEDPIKRSRNTNASALELRTAVACASALRAHLAPYLLRRMKRDVNMWLPPKHERVIRCPLSDSQLAEYVARLRSPDVQDLLYRCSEIRRELEWVDKNGRAPDGGLVSGVRGRMTTGMRHEAWRVLSQLRLISNHVDLWKLKLDDIAEGGSGTDILFRSNRPVDFSGSSKILTLKALLTDWKAKGHKVLVFSQYRVMLDIIENMVEQEGYTYLRIDGTTPSRHRCVLIDRFNEDPAVFVALLTTRVGGLGVNLTGADRVVIFDPDWNPVTDEQARERSWRIGQTREVCVYRMIASGTVEEHIFHRQLAKTYVTEKVLNDPTLQRFFSVASVAESFLLGPEYAFRLPERERIGLISNGAELRQLIAQNEKEAKKEVDGEGAQNGGDDRGRPAARDTTAETHLLASLVDGDRVVSVETDPLLCTLAAATAMHTLRKAVTGGDS